LVPLLRIIAYVTNGTDQQTQKVIDNGFVDLFYQLLVEPDCDKRIVKEVLWIISNITIGTPEQITQTILSVEKYRVMITHARDVNPEIQKEAVWAICNACKNATYEQIQFMVDNGMLILYHDLLEINQKDEVLLTILEALFYVLGKVNYDDHNNKNPYIEIMFNLETDLKIEGLQKHKNNRVYDLSIKILESYFDLSDEFGN